MKTVPLADVLWDAANSCLDHGQEMVIEQAEKPTRYLTCNALAKALCPAWWWTDLPKSVNWFLISLGCPISSPDAFSHLDRGEHRQGARYMWLLLAMHVAADEKIMVEIA